MASATTPEKKLVRSKSGLRIVSRHESNRSPFELCEPPWIRDNECFECKYCQVKFALMKRRHHCRRCGYIFCNDCCKTTVALPRMCFVDPVRLCTSCAELTHKENEFYDKHLKTLTSGANFSLSDNRNSSNGDDNTFLCRLSSDHKRLLFDSEGSGARREAVEFSAIQNLKVIRPSEGCQDIIMDLITDSTLANGLQILYDGCNSEKCEVTLMIDSATSSTVRMQSTAWIAALLKAAKMMFESRGSTSP